jgi:hypothetical protein
MQLGHQHLQLQQTTRTSCGSCPWWGSTPPSNSCNCVATRHPVSKAQQAAHKRCRKCCQHRQAGRQMAPHKHVGVHRPSPPVMSRYSTRASLAVFLQPSTRGRLGTRTGAALVCALGDTCQRAAHLLRTAPDMTVACCPYITRTTAGPVIPTAATQQHHATISNSQLLSAVLTCATAAGLDAEHRRCSQVCSYGYCHHGCHSLTAGLQAHPCACAGLAMHTDRLVRHLLLQLGQWSEQQPSLVPMVVGTDRPATAGAPAAAASAGGPPAVGTGP